MEVNLKNFPKRNRIISGIANSILVVEAEYRSGSSVTAHYATNQGKNVYAIPSNITSSSGIGTNNLIRNGAILVTKPSQIQKDYQKYFVQNSKKKQVSSDVISSQIPKKYSLIYGLLQNGPMYINEIAKIQNMSISELNGVMTMMEIEGYVTRLDSNLYQKRE